MRGKNIILCWMNAVVESIRSRKKYLRIRNTAWYGCNESGAGVKFTRVPLCTTQYEFLSTGGVPRPGYHSAGPGALLRGQQAVSLADYYISYLVWELTALLLVFLCSGRKWGTPLWLCPARRPTAGQLICILFSIPQSLSFESRFLTVHLL